MPCVQNGTMGPVTNAAPAEREVRFHPFAWANRGGGTACYNRQMQRRESLCIVTGGS